MGLFSWSRKKPVVKPKPPSPVRVTVWLTDGETYVTHYACWQAVSDKGTLTLWSGPKDEKRMVAQYAPGTWMSQSAGKRSVTRIPNNLRR